MTTTESPAGAAETVPLRGHETPKSGDGAGHNQPERGDTDMANAAFDVLVLEPDPRGHTEEWLQHLIDHVEQRQAGSRLTLVVAPELAHTLSENASERVRIVAMSDRESRLGMHSSLLVSAFSRWSMMRRYLKATGAGRGLFLTIDHLSLPLGLKLPLPRPVSGILFRPTTHYREFGSGPRNWKERLRDLHKRTLTRMMLRNRRLSALYSLDPYFPAYAARMYPGGDKVVPVGDPACPPPKPTDDERALVADVPQGRTAFVLFGEITERKGPLPLLESLARLAPEVAATTSVVMAGRIDPPIRDELLQKVDAVRAARPELWLKVVDRRLASGEITALIDRSDAVLVPYQRFVGSSGVLLWAAQRGRPVICQDYGLVGELTRSFGLGATVDSSDPAALADAISAAVAKGPSRLCDQHRMYRFVKARTPEAFASRLLSDGTGRGAAEAAESAKHGGYEWSQRYPV